MTPYQNLLAILDRLRAEAPPGYASYHPPDSNLDAVNAARSRAFLHLYLKVHAGLLTFAEREPFITEGPHDGGVDAYYIDGEAKTIIFLQAKFRTTERNFEEKTIDPEELLAMDINRIIDGEMSSLSGQPYNSKILEMMRQIRSIPDIGRYRYRVIILANVKGVTRQKLDTLTGNLPSEVIDHRDCYSQLVFPLVSGTYFHADELRLAISLSNKSAGAKISYTVTTEFTDCEITVVFVPTIEIARAMLRYRNSILEYNPRSYLGHEGQLVNREIRRSIETRNTNEFALFNNGITILSDETYLNERIGQRGRAQLVLVNPQIINGGQTAYTLSMIYQEYSEAAAVELFESKEVLVKIITFQSATQLEEGKKAALIDEISRATNQQTAVTVADRRSNERAIKSIQARLFDRSGIFLERKRGEFEDGQREGYIQSADIVDRTLFFRAAFAAQGRLPEATKKRLAAKASYAEILNVSDEVFDSYAFAVRVLARYLQRIKRNPLRVTGLVLAKLYLGVAVMSVNGAVANDARIVDDSAAELDRIWSEFETFVGGAEHMGGPFSKASKPIEQHIQRYIKSPTFAADLRRYKTAQAVRSGRNGLTSR